MKIDVNFKLGSVNLVKICKVTVLQARRRSGAVRSGALSGFLAALARSASRRGRVMFGAGETFFQTLMSMVA
ncbi:hypothetical protein CHELA1G11_14706 [Hyphomicrobiales bacterium]|nr:hypothetical protein CHELA1G2_14400 [Hyphomicrobiales bacterium]CAH1680397.1 hypothetical protein CHELA1G11_14706 [Hyphomicrobiales bacterium]